MESIVKKEIMNLKYTSVAFFLLSFFSWWLFGTAMGGSVNGIVIIPAIVSTPVFLILSIIYGVRATRKDNSMKVIFTGYVAVIILWTIIFG